MNSPLLYLIGITVLAAIAILVRFRRKPLALKHNSPTVGRSIQAKVIRRSHTIHAGQDHYIVVLAYQLESNHGNTQPREESRQVSAQIFERLQEGQQVILLAYPQHAPVLDLTALRQQG